MSEDTLQRFLVDLMLMRLGRWLRLLGQDVANPEGVSDEELLRQAKKEGRTIITRDKGLFQACRGAGASGTSSVPHVPYVPHVSHGPYVLRVPCILIRSSAISDQILEMADARVPLRLDPRRCTLCNGPLEESAISGMKRWQCRDCKKLYWEGGHWKKMEKMLEDIRCRREENAGSSIRDFRKEISG